MYDFIDGDIDNVTPTVAVINNNGIGYSINISLNTFTQVKDLKQCRLYIHQVVREDAISLFGFFEKEEREVFQNLITVSGIGPNTARVVLSALTAQEVVDAVANEDAARFQSVKGIGAKTASRIIIDLKGKIDKGNIAATLTGGITVTQNKNEALSALVMLGFNKQTAEKALNKVIKDNNNEELPVDRLVKLTLQIL